MTKPLVRIHDIETDQIIEREMSDQEFTEHEAKLAAIAEEDALKATKAAEKAALLAQLGITEDQAKLLLS